jgi:polar amino acid transport system substrate-binding protein
LTHGAWWFTLLGLLWAGPPVAAAPPPLRWAADEEGGIPFVFPDPDRPGQNRGFEVDLTDLLARELGREIRWLHYDFKSLFSGLKRGDFDLAMNGLEVLPERLREVRFSRPYYVYRLQLVVRRDDPRFGTLRDVRQHPGAVVGTLEGTAAERALDRLRIPKRVYDGQTELYKELATGRIDAVYLDTIIHGQYLPRFPELRLVGPAEYKGYYAIALRNDQAELAGAVDQALQRGIESGAVEKIYRKWKIWNDDQHELGAVQDYRFSADEPEREEQAPRAEEEWAFSRYAPLLLRGAGMTVFITVASMLLAIALGLPIALARMYGPTLLRWLAVGHVEFFRGIPVLLLLYFLYYGLADLARLYGLGQWLELSPLTAAILGLGISYSAYEAEIYRAGIAAIPAGQWEAAASLGMSGPLTFRRIILPQALRIVLPPMTNDFVALFKDTSVVSIIAVVELSKEYQMLSKTTFKYVEIGLLTAALYLIMSVPLGYLSRRLEKKWGRL